MRADREHQTAIAAAVTKGLQGDGAAQRVGADATKFLGCRQAEQADRGALTPQLAREGLRPVALDDFVVQFAAGKLDDAVAQQLLLAGEVEVHQGSSFRRW